MVRKKYLPQDKGFSYVEVIIALTVASASALGFMQASLAQAQSSAELNTQLQAQLLLLQVQNFIVINKHHILQNRQAATLFSVPSETSCSNDTDRCQKTSCTAAELLEHTFNELQCLAVESGNSLHLELEQTKVGEPQIVSASLWRNEDGCESEACKIIEQRIWL